MPRVYSPRWTTSRPRPCSMVRCLGRRRGADPKRELRMHSLRPRHRDDSSQAPPAIQPEDGTKPLSAQEAIAELSRRAVLDLLPAPPAIPIPRVPVIPEAGWKSEARLLLTPAEGAERLLADHSEATSRPRTQAGQTRVQARTPEGQPRDSGTADQSHGKDSGRRGRSPRKDPGLDLARPWWKRGRTVAGWGRGCHFRKSRSDLERVQLCTMNEVPTPLRALDPWKRRCPRCRRRTRQYQGVDRPSGDRRYAMLCAPCARALRMAYRDQRARERRFIDLDPPAPLCHGCYHRPRISKGTRRGKRRYFRFCGPCDRAHRVDQGLPAYRGERGARMWLHDQLRPEEERNRYPWPKSDADRVRPSPFAASSSWEEILDDVGALKRETLMDLVAVHALLHTPPLVTMDGWFDAPAASTSTALALSPPIPVPLAPRSADPADRPLEEGLGSTSSPRGPRSSGAKRRSVDDDREEFASAGKRRDLRRHRRRSARVGHTLCPISAYALDACPGPRESGETTTSGRSPLRAARPGRRDGARQPRARGPRPRGPRARGPCRRAEATRRSRPSPRWSPSSTSTKTEACPPKRRSAKAGQRLPHPAREVHAARPRRARAAPRGRPPRGRPPARLRRL